MSVESVRRYYLLKRLAAAVSNDTALESLWAGKQAAESGTELDATFPYVTRLATAGYVAVEDLDGATVEELQQSGFTSREAAAVLAAL
jgi:hypothetical protein